MSVVLSSLDLAKRYLCTLKRHLLALEQMFTEAFVTWEHTRRPPSHRKCKYTVSLLMRLFSVPLLAHSVASDTLRDFVSAMLLTLIDGRVLEIQEGGNLMKARRCNNAAMLPSTPA
jgi:hypothetical protein